MSEAFKNILKKHNVDIGLHHLKTAAEEDTSLDGIYLHGIIILCRVDKRYWRSIP